MNIYMFRVYDKILNQVGLSNNSQYATTPDKHFLDDDLAIRIIKIEKLLTLSDFDHIHWQIKDFYNTYYLLGTNEEKINKSFLKLNKETQYEIVNEFLISLKSLREHIIQNRDDRQTLGCVKFMNNHYHFIVNRVAVSGFNTGVAKDILFFLKEEIEEKGFDYFLNCYC